MNKIKLKIEDVCQKYDDKLTLNNINLQVDEGEIVVFLGPSGCGKTTLLKAIAGLISITSGKIYIGEKSVENLTPQQRNTAMIFQNYALFPHMTVRENIEYGLKIRKADKRFIKEQTDIIIDMTKLSGLEDRQITQLSGGQQQRVAIARAMVIKPDLMLFDEPLSNLDENLRLKMRREIKRMLKEVNITSIYVTHDQNEAMAIADKIVIMKDGFIQQISTPEELYYKPINQYVANFTGHNNIYDIDIKDGKYEILGNIFTYPEKISIHKKLLIPAEVISICNDENTLHPAEAEKLEIKAIIKDIESFTSIRKYLLQIGEVEIEMKEINSPIGRKNKVGDEISISIASKNFHFMDN